jgi:hypothetical protein
VVQHHEKFAGTGYPAGLAGEEISFGARVVAVADAYEVITAVVLVGEGLFVYTAPAAFTGTDSFTYTIADPGGLTSTATVTITVTAP